jgi:Tfp pilus assembly protein PilN
MEKNFMLRIIGLMTVAFISGLCFNIWQNLCKSSGLQFVPYSDTIVVLKATIDTLEVERIKTKTIYEKQIDTIYLLDSIAIDSAYTKAINRLQQLEGSGFFKH